MSKRVGRPTARRLVTGWIAVTGAVATFLAGSSAASAATATAAPAAHSLSGSNAAWADSSWASTNGNTVTDVAKAIGSSNSGLDGTGVGIALIDTGVAPVPGLPAAHVVNGPDLSFDSQAANLRYLDTYGHGTHLAGIMVGNDNSAGLRGIAPGAKLTSIKVGASGGVVDVTQVIAALNWVVDHRNDDPTNPIKIVNLAYGTDSAAVLSSDPLLYAVEHAYYNGILVVVAGGNQGTSLGRLDNPAQDPFILKVGSAATNGTAAQTDDTVSSFTSVSPTQQLDVVAPGESIVSLRDPGSSIDVSYPGARVGTRMFRGSGSSQATAVVAAAAALLYQKQPRATPTQIRNWMRDTAKPLTGANANRTAGELNVAKALATPMVQYPSLTGPDSNGLGSLESSRGGTHVVHNNTTLSGATDIFGAFCVNNWVDSIGRGNEWQGGVWMGHRLAGDGWTGTSWASKTWAPATWSGTDWASQSWTDNSWTGHYWSGGSWSGGDWSGHYWSSSTWAGQSFSGVAWHTASWG